MLAGAIPGERQVIGIDLAQGMVDVADARIEASSDPTLRWAANLQYAECSRHTCPSLQPALLVNHVWL